VPFQKEFEISAQRVRAFADLVEDHNPVHLDPEFAATTRYRQPICHGLLVASFISGCLAEHFGQGTIYVEQKVRFRRPVPVGSRIRVQLGDPQPLEDGQVSLSTTVHLLQGSLWKSCLEGEAIIIPPT
jgi:acyl dehydratase